MLVGGGGGGGGGGGWGREAYKSLLFLLSACTPIRSVLLGITLQHDYVSMQITTGHIYTFKLLCVTSNLMLYVCVIHFNILMARCVLLKSLL